MQDPEIFLNELGVSLNCAVDSGRPAIIDAAHRITVGYETFFFSDSAAMQEFQSDIPAHCGTLTDPITRTRFKPNKLSPNSSLNGIAYYFASDSTKSAFDMMPDMYRWPNYQMMPKDTTTRATSPE